MDPHTNSDNPPSQIRDDRGRTKSIIARGDCDCIHLNLRDRAAPNDGEKSQHARPADRE